ncbi:MAG: hypothetical protein GF346_06135 [Candidatus Eisenbacteria bacterium]|nr:hypothetical protein [Candidatus Latescibacterota bacterium]MBD3302004.1 hypothetical protein [Candidatus Eisenbacteria bacterium]
MAAGRATQNEIAQGVGIESKRIVPYLHSLTRLRLVERSVPVQERQARKSRKGRYRILDPFVRFWFRFVFPNRSRLEQGLVPEVYSERIGPHLDEHTSFVFEELARDHLWSLARRDVLPFSPDRIGSWHSARDEVDVVAVDRTSQEVLAAECKWSRKPIGVGVLELLEERAEQVRSSLGAHRIHLALFSRSGFRPELTERAKATGILLFEPSDLVRG